MSAFDDAVRCAYHPVIAEALIASRTDPRFNEPTPAEMARRIAHLQTQIVELAELQARDQNQVTP